MNNVRLFICLLLLTVGLAAGWARAADYTFAGEGVDYLLQRAGMTGNGQFCVGNYEYTKPVFFRDAREVCPRGVPFSGDDFEITHQGRSYEWSRVHPFGGVRQFLYHTDQMIDYGTARRIDRDAGEAWGEKTLSLAIRGILKKTTTLHEKKIKAIQLEWQGYLENARRRLVTAYVELKAWGLDAATVVAPAVGAYRAYVADRAWKGLNDRNPKKRNLACSELTRLDANLNEAIDVLYEPLLAKKTAAFREWELAHPELARTLAEKRRTAESEAQVRKLKRRVADAERTARAAEADAAAAWRSASAAAQRAEEAERNARNAEIRARNAELGF